MINIPSKKILEEYVRESNRIENITVGKNHPLFVDHLAAANYIIEASVSGKMTTPEEIHKILMGRAKQEFLVPGELRKVFVRVGPYLKPAPETIPALLEKWNRNVKRFLKTASALAIEERGAIALHYHYWFEAIHPFVDGNGRTGRLILNNTRLLIGLPWLIVYSSKKWEYYDTIRNWEIKYPELLITGKI